MTTSHSYLTANGDVMATSPFYLKGEGNGVGMATSPFSLKWNGGGMTTSRVHLKKKDNEMIISSPFYLNRNRDGMATL